MNDFKIGQKVKIIGDTTDFTEELDGHIGIIKEIRDSDITVDIIDRSTMPVELNYDWMIWKINAKIINE